MPLLDTDAGSLFYVGQGHGPATLLCIHGAGGSHQHWGLQLRGLSDAVCVVALDLPGHGRSPGPGRSSVAAYSQVIIAALDALGLERAVLAGHSMGGAVALQTALDAPARVAGLALIGTAARLRVLPAIIEGMERAPNATVDMLVARFYAATAPANLRERGNVAFRQTAPLILRDDFLACDAFDVRERLPAIACPTLIICGDEDQMTPPKFSQSLHSQIAGSQLLLMPNTGHMAMLEDPAAVNTALRQFLLASGVMPAVQ